MRLLSGNKKPLGDLATSAMGNTDRVKRSGRLYSRYQAKRKRGGK